MFQKTLSLGLIAGFLLSYCVPVLAATTFNIAPTVDAYDIKLSTSTRLLPIKINEEEEADAPVGILATSTTIDNDVPDESEDDQSDIDESADEPVATNETTIPEVEEEKEKEKEEEPNKSVLPKTVETPDVAEVPSTQAIETNNEAENDLDLDLIKEGTVKMEAKDEAHDVVGNIDFSKISIGAVLDVCGIGPSCTGDVGKTHWVKESGIRPDDMKRGLRYSTQISDIKSGILQISYYSFAENENPGIIYSQAIVAGESVFDFNILSESESMQASMNTNLSDQLVQAVPGLKASMVIKTEKSLWEKIVEMVKSFFTAPINWVKSLFVKPEMKISDSRAELAANLKITHNTYYLRVVPTTASGNVAGQTSNEIKVSLAEPPQSVALYSPAKIYEVKIKDFKPIRAPEPGVCTGAMILDNDWVVNGLNGPQTIKKAGERVCPDTYQGEGEEAWYESLWNAAKSGVDWVSAAYNSLKSAVVDALASVACGGDDVCKMAISAGLDIGLAAMGVPPSLPNFDELVDGGFDYLASEIASQAGCPDVACKDLVKSKLKEVLEQNKNTNPGCKGEEEAHRMGIEPLCLPDNVKAHLDPLGTYRNAELVLEVKRNYLEGSGLSGVPYKLYFNNIAYNAGPVGSWIHNIEPYNESVEITAPLEGQAYSSKTVIVPELEKGQTIDIPVVLVPEEYWVPGHKEAMHGWSTVVYKDGWPQYQYDDWWKLYYGGTLTLGAVIYGCEYSYDMDDCLISSDTVTVQLPNTLNP